MIRIIALFLLGTFAACHAQDNSPKGIVLAAERTEIWLPALEGKRVALVANHTTRIGNVHLLDSMLQLGVRVKKVFSPEHGFRGDADAGAHVAGGVDSRTGVQVVSLYGSKKKPEPADLVGIDVVVFDIQDVGARFYTYISTLSLVMEACAENDIPVMVFDRPNPNGFYVDGPLLDKQFTSFVGMHPVPVVHGMTVGEYALMVNGEGWLTGGVKSNLSVISMLNYHHDLLYQLPEKPSPNLPDMTSVYLYPSLCFFEGTFMSVGRGTSTPFRIVGHPDYKVGTFSFTPVSTPGASINPPFKDQVCHGFDYSHLADSILGQKRLFLQPVIDAYLFFKDKPGFFNNYFNTLAGNSSLRRQIESGLSEAEIRASWQKDLEKFKGVREKYLLY